jgi:hypothetical protein
MMLVTGTVDEEATGGRVRVTPTVQIMSRGQLQERRQELLSAACMDESKLRQAAADYLLSAEQTAILDEIDRIDYLLGA